MFSRFKYLIVNSVFPTSGFGVGISFWLCLCLIIALNLRSQTLDRKLKQLTLNRYFQFYVFSCGQDINKGTLLEDAFGECLPAKHVFKHAIKYLTDDLLAETSRGAVKLQARDILWVLTVPAIWNEMAKRFMREAAEEVHQIKLIRPISNAEN